jgi:hypothetical protein
MFPIDYQPTDRNHGNGHLFTARRDILSVHNNLDFRLHLASTEQSTVY